MSSGDHPNASSTAAVHHKADSRFSCNICLEPVLEPVVTFCGHLYCWPCLYRWLEPGFSSQEFASFFGITNHYRAAAVGADASSRRTCPVCKSPCSVNTIVPIYVRNAETTPTNHKKDDDDYLAVEETSSSVSSGVRRRLRFQESPIPARPSYSATTTARSSNNPMSSPRTPTPAGTAARLPPPPAGMSLQQALFRVPPPVDNPTTEFLSRLLIMLGSFVVLCLLLF